MFSAMRIGDSVAAIFIEPHPPCADEAFFLIFINPTIISLNFPPHAYGLACSCLVGCRRKIFVEPHCLFIEAFLLPLVYISELFKHVISVNLKILTFFLPYYIE